MSVEERPKKSNALLYIIGIVLLIILGVGVLIITTSKNKSVAKEANEKEKAVKEGPVVKVVQATNSAQGKTFTVIGEVRPYQSVTLYPKISGFLKKINVDKGDRVTEDQVLGTIESPETDQLYQAALADAANKKAIMKRDSELLVKHYVSQEQADLSRTVWQVAGNNVNSYKALVGYEILKAPFNGVVTARYVDNGALLQNAANSQGGAQPLVTVSQLDKVRIYYYVNQSDAGYIHPGYPVEITLANSPEKVAATVTRFSGQLDPNTRMMLAETDLDNKTGKFLPGSYLQVNITSPTGNGYPQVPVDALLVRNNKYFVGLLTKDTTVHFQEIKIKENTGEKILVQEGLKEGDTVALNLGESIADGAKVRVSK